MQCLYEAESFAFRILRSRFLVVHYAMGLL